MCIICVTCTRVDRMDESSRFEVLLSLAIFFFKQKTAYEMRISDWSSDVCSSDLEHATYHIKYDAPLTADIEGLARPVSHWVRTSPEAKSVARDGAEAITAAMSGAGQIATLILPANTAWNEAEGAVRKPAVPPLPTVGARKEAAQGKGGDGREDLGGG